MDWLKDLNIKISLVITMLFSLAVLGYFLYGNEFVIEKWEAVIIGYAGLVTTLTLGKYINK